MTEDKFPAGGIKFCGRTNKLYGNSRRVTLFNRRNVQRVSKYGQMGRQDIEGLINL